MRRSIRSFAGILVLAASARSATAQTDLYWDADGTTSSSTGGTGTWTTANTWRAGSATGTLGNWSDGNNAFFQGTAGTVTVGATAVTANSIQVQVTGYTFQTDASTTTRTMTGPITLSNNVSLSLNDATATTARNLNIGSVSGGVGSTLTIQGAQTGGNASRINLSTANTSIAVPITLNGTGTGVIGIVSTNTGNSISGTITNNSTATTIIGATSGNALTLTSTAVISGSAGLQFSAGPSGGAGVVTLNSQSTYSGTTTFNAANSGIVRLGVNNALSTSSDVVMGASASNGGILDLNGFNQTIASLTNGAGGSTTAANITNSTATASTSTLTINGSATPGAFTRQIADGTTGGVVALSRGGTGSTTLTGDNTYTGGTTVTGGSLIANNTTAGQSSTGSGAVTVSGTGTLGGGGRVGGNIAINSGGTVAPSSTSTSLVGTLTNSGTTTSFAGGGNYQFQMTNGNNSAVAGTDYDTLAAQALNLTGVTSANKFNLILQSLSNTTTTGSITAANFDVNSAHTYTLISTVNGVTGFTGSNQFAVDTSGFSVAGTGTLDSSLFTVGLSGNSLVLQFTPVPEPGTVLGVAAAGLGLARLVRRQRAAV